MSSHIRQFAWLSASISALACMVQVADLDEKKKTVGAEAGLPDAEVPDTGLADTADAATVPCDLPHATSDPAARASACVISSCEIGYGDCNAEPLDGCETDVSADPEHCGGCGQYCAADGGNFTCNDGQCQPTSCAAGSEDCDGNANNGCEITTSSDPLNCKFCGNVCVLANAGVACSAGDCVISSCDTDYQNCDGVNGNGCESHRLSDLANCGNCGNVCNGLGGTAQCVNGACQIICAPNRANCDGALANGCEVELGNDELHCGSCTTVCGTAHTVSSICLQGQCTLGCTSEWKNCNGQPNDGCEVHIKTNPDNCGACGNGCGPAQTCQAGVCAG